MSRAGGRRERNKQDKRQRILHAAKELFQSGGYEKTRMQQIAGQAGVAAGTLFLYAKSKEDLLLLVFIEEMTRVLEESFASVDRSAPAELQVTSLFQGFIEYHAADPAIARVLVRELSFVTNRARIREVNRLVSRILQCLRQLIAAAGPLDRELLASLMFSFYYQQLQAWLVGYITREVFENRLARMADHLLNPA